MGTGDIALELGERGHHVQQKLVGGGASQFRGRDNQEFHPCFSERPEDVNAVNVPTSEAVETVDDDLVDALISDVPQEALESRPIGAASREADIIETPADPFPRGVGLGLNEVATDLELNVAG